MAIFVIVLFAVALGYPYWWAAILRYRMIRRLRGVCRERGLRLRPLRKFLVPIRNRGAEYDLLIENKERIFAVKLWSAYRRGDTLVVTKNGQVRHRRYAPVVLDVRRGAKPARSESGARSVRRTKLSLSPKETRTVTRILLVYPSYRAILREEGRGERRLASGDPIFDKQLHSPSSLESLLRSEESSRENGEAQNPKMSGKDENFKQI